MFYSDGILDIEFEEIIYMLDEVIIIFGCI